jgi:predicted membrane protein
MMTSALLTSMMMLLACGTPSAGFTTETTQNRDFKERDEVNQTYELTPGARVEVSSIRGPVEIFTADTTTAEVKIIRTAGTRADLDYHKIAVQLAGNIIVVRGVQESEGRRAEKVYVDHHVILKLPRRIDLSVKSISGWIKVGDVEGQTHVSSISGSADISNVGDRLQVSSISGSLEVGNVGAEARVSSISGDLRLGQVNGSLEVSGVSGGLKATLVSLSPQGIQIKSVSGSIEIGFKSEVNADLNVESVSGQVYLDVPNVTRDSEIKPPNVRARIGAGGTPITIFSVSGNIRLTRS